MTSDQLEIVIISYWQDEVQGEKPKKIKVVYNRIAKIAFNYSTELNRHDTKIFITIAAETEIDNSKAYY